MAAPAECAASADAAICSGVTGTLALFLTESPEPVTAQGIKTALVNIASTASPRRPDNPRRHRWWARGRRCAVAVVPATRHDSNRAVRSTGGRGDDYL